MTSTSGPTPLSSVDVESADVIRLVQQFLKENGLTQSLYALQKETQVTLNTVDSLATFSSNVTSGQWEIVLQDISTLKLPDKSLIDLYEQIIIELVEMKEVNAARTMLRQTDPMAKMKKLYPERYRKLESVIQRPFFDARDVYPDGVTKEKRRAAIANSLAGEVSVVPPSRLLALLGQSVKWQQQQGLLPHSERIDLFRGCAVTSLGQEDEAVVKVKHTSLRYGEDANPECAVFSANGQCIITGSNDGFIEVWNHMTGRLRLDLKYQQEERFMMMQSAVLSIAVSPNSVLVATGSVKGVIKVWNLETGACLAKLEKAHSEGVTSISFSRDSSQILSSSYDKTIRIHGLKSKKLLKEFRGHSSFVNQCLYTADGMNMISCSSDGTVRIWDIKSMECRSTLRPSVGVQARDVTVTSIALVPRNVDQFVVCNKTDKLHIMNMSGQVVKSYSNNKKSVFVGCCMSARGGYLYAVAEDKNIYCFDVEEDEPINVIENTHTSEVVGILHHPQNNIVGTYGEDGALHMYKAKAKQ